MQTLETSTAIVCACMPSIRALGVRHCPRIIGNTSRGAKGDTAPGSGIHLSRSTRVHSVRVGKSDKRSESQEPWIGEIGNVATITTHVAADKASYHNTYSTKPTAPSQIFENENTDDELEKERRGQSSKSSLHAMLRSDVNWDKSLPPTPLHNIPMTLASIHVGEQAARILYSKFSPHHGRNLRNNNT